MLNIFEMYVDVGTVRMNLVVVLVNNVVVDVPNFCIVYLFMEPAIDRIEEHVEVFHVQMAIVRVVSSNVYTDNV